MKAEEMLGELVSEIVFSTIQLSAVKKEDGGVVAFFGYSGHFVIPLSMFNKTQ